MAKGGPFTQRCPSTHGLSPESVASAWVTPMNRRGSPPNDVPGSLPVWNPTGENLSMPLNGPRTLGLSTNRTTVGSRSGLIRGPVTYPKHRPSFFPQEGFLADGVTGGCRGGGLHSRWITSNTTLGKEQAGKIKRKKKQTESRKRRGKVLPKPSIRGRIREVECRAAYAGTKARKPPAEFSSTPTTRLSEQPAPG